MGKVAQAMNPKAIAVLGKKVGEHFNTASYQTTHLNGARSWVPTRKPVR